MPRFKNGRGEYEYADVIFNSSTMINRENPGQNFEASLNHIGSEIINHIISEKLGIDESYSLIRKFISMCSEEQANYMDAKVNELSREEWMFFVESISNEGAIHLSIRPLTEFMTIDKLRDIYKEFPFVHQNKIEVVISGSDGKPRYVPARRDMVIGKQYIYRLNFNQHIW